jgi:HlyD family secretion protein
MSTTSITAESVKEHLGIERHAHRFTHLRPWLFGILLIVGLVVAVVAARWSAGTGQPVAAAYVTQNAVRGDLRVTVTATGTLTPINQVDVGSELSGIVKTVAVDYNDRVRAGQVLARLDTTKLQAQASQIRAGLDAARAKAQQTQATLEEAKAQLKRAEALAANQLLPPSDLDTAQATLKRAEADRSNAAAAVAQAEATLQATETDLTKMVIRSPITGIVLKRTIEPGQTVAASFQAPVLFTLAEDLTKMELDIDVDEADVGQVQAGQEATFTVDAYPDRSFSARVAKVSFSATTTGGVVTYKTALNVDNSNLLLRPGMTTTADVLVGRVANGLLVPNAALRFTPASSSEPSGSTSGGLFGRMMPRPARPSQAAAGAATRGKAQRVWIVRDGRATAVDVTVGMTDGRMTEVTGGDLEAGTAVIVQAAAQK